MSTININGISFTGNSIRVNNGKVYIDGDEVTPTEKQINIQISGDVDNIDVDACDSIRITGNVNTVQLSSGSVEISGNVGCNLKTSSGNIRIDGNVIGDIKTVSGNVKANEITGDVKTVSGSIKR
jgi:DUF4097 and DUF4098 domain-containing protein YvlB